MKIITRSLVLFFSLWIITISGETKLTSVIKTDVGSVRGKIQKTILNSFEYAAFLGIPFAEPPIGNLRFKPPVEKKSWNGILNATIEGSMCPQYNSVAKIAVGSEDCLYLNVYTPHTTFDTSTLKAVMVYFYGGGYTNGDSSSAMYGPDFLVEKDVILVALNYRLNAFGFLNLNHDGASGNMGLKDQNMVLKWVNRNIEKFGGDPNRVTIFGQSAGGASVDLNMISDESVGLFHRSIAMSGSPFCFHWAFQTQIEAEQRTFELGLRLGIKTNNKDELMKKLLNASADDIIIALSDIDVFPFRPTIESTEIAKDEQKFLTQCPLKKYMTANYTKGPHMLGFAANEMIFFSGVHEVLFGLVGNALKSIKNASLTVDLPILSNLTAGYKQGKNLQGDSLNQFIEESSDLVFNLGIDTKQQLINKNNGFPIYYYRFSFDSNYSLHRTLGIDLEGATHADELPYVFHFPAANLPLNDPEIAITRERIIRLWTNFAKYGNPTPDDLKDDVIGIKWIESGVEGNHLNIDKKLTIGSRPVGNSVKSLQSAGLGASPILNDCS